MERAEIEARTADGRLIKIQVAGPADGDLIIWVHGIPGSCHLHSDLIAAAAARGLCVAAGSRAGYERSDRQSGRRFADYATDVEAIAKRLEAETYYLLSESGGGAPALGATSRFPERVRAVTIVSSPAPFEPEGLDWFAGMASQNHEEYELAGQALLTGDDTALEAFLWAAGRKFSSAADGEQMGKAGGGLYSASDRAALKRDPSHQQICWRRIMQGGILGWVDDLKTQRGEWGFDLDAVTVPVTVRQGTEDKAVPLAHGKWLSHHLPNARLQTPPEGHISIWDFDVILDDLIASRATAAGEARVAPSERS